MKMYLIRFEPLIHIQSTFYSTNTNAIDDDGADIFFVVTG